MEENEAVLKDAFLRMAKREEKLIKAKEALGLASSRYQMAAGEYVAVRDRLREMLEGMDPYTFPSLFFPDPDNPDLFSDEYAHLGKFRYLEMATGQAVFETLLHADEPLTLLGIYQALKSGGLDLSERSINASLLNMKGIVKIEIKRSGASAYTLESRLDHLYLDESDPPC